MRIYPDKSIVKMLIDAGTYILNITFSGLSILNHTSAYYKDCDIVSRLLIEAGADVNQIAV